MVVLTNCGSSTRGAGSGATVPPAASDSSPSPVTSTPQATRPTAPAAAVANLALSTRARDTGRTNVAICLYVDPPTQLDPDKALDMLQESIDALVSDGYSVLASPAASRCPQAPLYIRTSSVHPKNSGNGPTAPVPRVDRPSEWMLWFIVTTPVRNAAIFGASVQQHGAEEVTCTGDNCGEVTSSIYVAGATFADTFARRRLILVGLGVGAQQ